MRWFVLAALQGLALSACDDAATLEQLQARAANDFDCPKSSLHVSEIDERTQAVRGCGQRATYVESCEQSGPYNTRSDCTWIKNGGTQKAEPNEE